MTAPRAREQADPPSPPDRRPSPRGGRPFPSTASAAARPAGFARLAGARRGLVGSAHALAAAALLALLAAAPALAQTPSVDKIHFQLAPASGDTYTLGEVVQVRVRFDGDVEVTDQSLLGLALTVGSVTEQASAVSWSSRDLTFRYTVKASDLDDDGIGIPANPLSLNGGAITVPGDPTTAVTLTHAGIPDDATRKVNGSTVAAPTVQTIRFTSTPATGDTFRRGETIVVAVTFDTAVTVRGDPQFALTIGENVRNASRRDTANATVSLSFHYMVEESDVDTDGISVAANALSLNGGAIELAADGTTPADITHAAVADDPLRKVDGTLDMAPTVETVYVEFAPENGMAYQLSEEIRARALFDNAIEVTGRPQLALTIGMTTRQATYSRTWGRTRMEFLYTVQASDMDDDGISISANALTLNGGTIKGAAGTHDAVLTHAAADADLTHKVDGSTYSAPQVTSVGFSFHPNDGQTYVRGEMIYMSVRFDRMADVTGSPRVALIIGSNRRYATYDIVAGENPFQLRFVYTVQASDMDADGISIPANAVDLNGGTITLPGEPTVAAVLTHSQVDNDPMRKVDGSTVPMVKSVSFIGTPDSGKTYTAREPIGAYVQFDSEVDVTGEPQLALAIGANTRQASFIYVWEDNPSYILFTYIVQTSDTDADGINFPANALSLNGGTITLRGDTTTDAVLTHSATAADETRKVDGGGSTAPPTVESVAVKSAPQSGDTYGWGETIVFTLTFSQKVRVTGQPQPTLAFDLGRSTREARYTGITDIDVDSDPRPRPRPEGVKVHFAYTVQPGDVDNDGIHVRALASAIDLGGARIQNAADLVDEDGHKVDGADAVLAHAALGRLPAHKVDGGTAQPPAGSGITIIDTFGNPLTDNRLTLRENTRGRYGFKLNTRPTHTVRVTAIASDGDPDLQVLPTANATMAITPDEWKTPFYMELRAAVDDDEEIGERVFLNHSSSLDPAYHDLTLPDVVVVEDERADDAGALSVADAEATEGVDDTLDFVVKLDRRPSQDGEVTVDYQTQDGTATAGSDYTSKSGTLDFAPGEDKKTVSVPIMDDAVEDDGETFTLVLSNAVNAGFARNGTQAVGTIRNTEPLTATFPESVYASAQHKGPSDRPQVVVAFSAPVEAFGADTPSVSATGASVDSVQRLDKEGLEHAYVFFLTPEGHQAIVFRLHANRACPDGGICTADGRSLSEGIATTVEGPETVPLTAAFEGLPASHDGEDAFRVRVTFSEGIGIGFRSMRDASFTVSGGEVTGARRVDGRHDLWEITVAPDSDEAMTITLPAGRACGVSGAICTRGENRRQLTNTPTATVAGPPVVPLTADFVQKPYEHDGKTAFKLRIAFSEGISIGFRTFRDHSVSATGGRVTKAKRVDRRKDLWEITVEPDTNEAVTLTLAGGRACGTAGAVCTGDGRALSAGISTRVLGPAALTVADARVDEAADAVLDFAVTLSRASSGTVAVAYATADGSATAGSDYTATAGTLTFAPGETAKTVTVPVLDDAHDEGEETLTLRLSAATGAVLADGVATGTIKNTDHMPQAWLARFGRTAATHVTDAVGERLRGTPGQGSHLTVGGYRLPLGQRGATDGADDGVSGVERLVLALGQRLGLGTGTAPAGAGGVAGAGGWPDAPVATDPRLGQSRTLDVGNAVNLRQVLLGSSFRLSLGAAATGSAGPRLTAWGRVAGTTFDGRDGKVSLDGDVLTGTVGVDGAWDRLLAGLAVAHSRGDGSYTLADTGAQGRGDLENTLTSIHPYLRYAVNDRLDVWGLFGYGWGDLTMEQGTGTTYETDTTLAMGAFGGRGILLPAGETGGFELVTRTDAMLTRTSSDAVAGMASADAEAHRLRLVLEGSRGFAWAEGRSLTPTMEVGLRHDWGDAETGFGLELGGRVHYADPALGLTIEAAVRGLLAHEDDDYQEWGASGSLRLAPGAGGQGLALTLAPTWGAASSGVNDLWSRQTTAGLAPQGTRQTPAGRLNAEIGYGVAAPFGTGLLTPYAGTVLSDGAARTYRVGGRLQMRGGWATGLELNLEGTRQDPAGQQPVNQGLRLQLTWGF